MRQSKEDSAFQLGLGLGGQETSLLQSRLVNGPRVAEILSHDPLWQSVARSAFISDIAGQSGYVIDAKSLMIDHRFSGSEPAGERNFGGAVIITPPLSNDGKITGVLHGVGDKLTAMGVCIVIEENAGDTDTFWRKSDLRESGFVKSEFRVMDGSLVWHARKKKNADRHPVDILDKFRHAQEYWRQAYFPIHFARVLARYASHGYEVVSFSEIEARLRSAKVVPFAMGLLDQGLGVDVLDRRCGVCVTHIDLRGNQVKTRACNNRTAHEHRIPAAALGHEKLLSEHVAAVRKAYSIRNIPASQETLGEMCPDCMSAIVQTAEEIGTSPVGRLFYLTRHCAGGEISYDCIGVVES